MQTSGDGRTLHRATHDALGYGAVVASMGDHVIEIVERMVAHT
jgi:bifunctional N-acetylglucosamine-1-phosphate-uridyltransferase/glucosamine-1-phosphate-acetyltransferase GlmU-like protein